LIKSKKEDGEKKCAQICDKIKIGGDNNDVAFNLKN